MVVCVLILIIVQEKDEYLLILYNNRTDNKWQNGYTFWIETLLWILFLFKQGKSLKTEVVQMTQTTMLRSLGHVCP